MKEKLKASTNWDGIKSTQDVLLLIGLIKTITFLFDDQKYPILPIHNAKTVFYSFRQQDLTNDLYLQRFQNLSDIATSMGGNLHDDAISKMIRVEL